MKPIPMKPLPYSLLNQINYVHYVNFV